MAGRGDHRLGRISKGDRFVARRTIPVANARYARAGDEVVVVGTHLDSDLPRTQVRIAVERENGERFFATVGDHALKQSEDFRRIPSRQEKTHEAQAFGY